MVDLKSTAAAVRFRRIETGNISYFKKVNEQERRYRYDPYGSGLTIKCNNLAMAMINDSLENHHNYCSSEYNSERFPNSDKLFLVFTLPMVEEIGALNTSYVWGCSYLPICGEIHSVWVMVKEKDIIDNYSDYTKDNSIDLSSFIDFEKAISFGMEERSKPKAGARFTDQGIAHIAPVVTDVIAKVERIITDIDYERINITVENLKQMIEESLEIKQGRVRSK